MPEQLVESDTLNPAQQYTASKTYRGGDRSRQVYRLRNFQGPLRSRLQTYEAAGHRFGRTLLIQSTVESLVYTSYPGSVVYQTP